jgi:hypothetical protein
MPHGSATPAAVWLRADQADLLRRALDLAGIEVIAAGGPGAACLRPNARRADDLRAMLASAETGLAILADPGVFADGAEPDDLRTLVTAAARGVTIVTLEPIPALATHLNHPAWRDASEVVRERIALAPLVRRGAAFRRAADLLDGFGPIEAVGITTLGTGAEGSLGARLAGACDLLAALVGEPHAIHAIHTPPRDHPGAPETLRDLRGHLAATFRFHGGQSASLFASDRAASWSRSVTILGPGGRITADDTAAVWCDPSDRRIQTLRAIATEGDLAAAVLADDLKALVGRAPRAAPVDLASVLSAAHAALLSTKTGNAEQPAELRRLSGV